MARDSGVEGAAAATDAAVQRRLSLLDAYNILDTPAERGFDDIAVIAAQVCGTPVALVSLVESHRQWFKARVGFDLSETPIEQSVCANDLDKPGILEIVDLTLDPRTSQNALVVGPPFARFYAGAPLIARDGHAVGRLCVIDTTPRPAGLDDGQRASLEALGRLVMLQLELRGAAQASDADAAQSKALGEAHNSRASAADRENEALRRDERRSRAAHRAGRIGTFEIEVPTGKVIVSPEFCEIFGLPVADSYHAEALEALIIAADRDRVSNSTSRVTGTAKTDVEYRIRRFDDGELRWIARRASFTGDDEGQILQMHGTVHDVTDRRRQEEQQDVLNQEISHRLKNTLSMVQAIAMQTLRAVPDRGPVDAFERRLMALASAHDILLIGNWRSAEIGAAAEAVLAQLGQSDRVRRHGPPVRLGPRSALTFAMLVHELATNAIKHGALSADAGGVDFGWRIDGGDLVAQWRESGGPAIDAVPSGRGFGSRLIRAGLAGTGGVDLRYDFTGLYVELRAPVAQLEQS